MRQSITGCTLAAFVIVTCILGAKPACAGDLEDATAAHGRGDYATALRLLRPLAEQGNRIAQHNLGASYYKGEGVAQDYKEAEKWFRLAAEQGYAGAQSSLGLIYLIRNDYKEALKWVQLSADQGNTPAQVNLGIMYYEGQGVARDYVRAHMWAGLAALQGDQNAAQIRDTIAKEMTRGQIAEAQKLAREWKPK